MKTDKTVSTLQKNGIAGVCKNVRENLHLSQKRLAELIGTNQTEISFIERGFIPTDGEKIERIKHLAEMCEIRV